jgi:ABC-type nitrate/sulfonate/bicarbonate transport system substrate-binding protein
MVERGDVDPVQRFRALSGGKFRILSKPYDAVAPQFCIGVWFTTRKWYEDHGDVVRKFVSVVYETAGWANAHHDETARLLAQFTGVDLQTIRSMTRTPYATSLDPADVQAAVDLAYRYHTIDRPIGVESLIAPPR